MVDGRVRRGAAQCASRRLQFPGESDGSRLQRDVDNHGPGENSRLQADQSLLNNRSANVWSCFERMRRLVRLRRMRDRRVLQRLLLSRRLILQRGDQLVPAELLPGG